MKKQWLVSISEDKGWLEVGDLAVASCETHNFQSWHTAEVQSSTAVFMSTKLEVKLDGELG